MWPFFSLRAGGMAYYALSLLREFCQIIPERTIVFYGSHGRELLNTVKEFRLIQSVPLNDPQELYDHRPSFDVLFTPNIWSGANMMDYPTVHVIPDIQEEFYPQFFSDFELNARHLHHPLAARASTLLITISHYSKRTIVDKFRVPETKVRVTHLGAHPIFSDPSNVGTRPKMMPENVRDYLFYPAHAWRHKNHKRLLDAVYELKRLHNLEVKVIFTGHLLDGDFNRVDIHQEILERGLKDEVFHIGTVSLSELKYLYLNARALIHPSLFEGFGIPLLEAMHVGCPIIAANKTSIPEISGNAALYFNPNDSADIAEKIAHFMNSRLENLERVKIGKVLARKFSDRRTAEETLKILEDAYDLSSADRLKAAASTKLYSSGRPLMTMVFFFDTFIDRKITREIGKLIAEFNNQLQVIAIVPITLESQLARIFNGRVETVVSGDTLSEAISEATGRVKGRYVFLSSGRSIMLPAFLYYLLACDGTTQTAVDLLDGDSFLMDTSTGTIRDVAVPLGLDDENRKPYSCSNLSFVFRAHVFGQTHGDSFKDCNSLPEVATKLWDLCSRERVYKIVNILFEDNTESKDFKISGAMARIDRRLASRANIAHWMQKGMLRSSLYSMLFLYYSMPLRFRSSISVAFRRLLVWIGNRKSRNHAV